TYHHSPSNIFLLTPSATTEIYTLSLHDALPICGKTETDDVTLSSRDGDRCLQREHGVPRDRAKCWVSARGSVGRGRHRSPSLLRSEEHTSELQSRSDLVCRLLLEKKNRNMSQVA